MYKTQIICQISVNQLLQVRLCGQKWAICKVSRKSKVNLHEFSTAHRVGIPSVQFSSVTQSCPALCDPMDCSTPGLPVHHQLPEFPQTHVHSTISSSVIPFFPCSQSFPASGSFQMSQLFTSGGQRVGVSASTSALPMNIQD